MIASILEHPEPHTGQIHPLYGPYEYTYPEMTTIIGRTLGRTIEYQQVPFEVMRDAFMTGGENSTRNNALSGYAESNRSAGAGESYTSQHLREAVLDYDNGLFRGTNDMVERLTGRAPMTIEDFVVKHRAGLSPTQV